MSGFGLITVYARREPTLDSIAINHGVKGKFDVVVYEDAECTKPKGRWSWYYTNKPTRRNKTVMLNCFLWKLVWLNDLKPET